MAGNRLDTTGDIMTRTLETTAMAGWAGTSDTTTGPPAPQLPVFDMRLCSTPNRFTSARGQREFVNDLLASKGRSPFASIHDTAPHFLTSSPGGHTKAGKGWAGAASATGQNDSGRTLPSACGDAHDGACFSQQLLDSLAVSWAVYEHTTEKMMLHIRQSQVTVSSACGTFRLLESCYIEDTVRLRRTDQPYALFQSSHGHYILGCRGTDCLRDLVQDFILIHRRLGCGKGAAHRGFVQRAERIPLGPLLEILSGGHNLVLTGHSMGGAVAALLTLRLLDATEGKAATQLQCITFGSPLFANGALADYINTSCKDLFVHVISQHDAVPRLLPLMSAAFHTAVGARRGDHPLDTIRFLTRCAGWIFDRRPLGLALGSVGGIIGGLARTLPWQLQGLLMGWFRFSTPSFSPLYALAGHMVTFSCSGPNGQPLRALSVDLRSITGQLGFVLGLNSKSLEEHQASFYVTQVACITQRGIEHSEAVEAAVLDGGGSSSHGGSLCCSYAGVVASTSRVLHLTESLASELETLPEPQGGLFMGLSSGNRLPGCEVEVGCCLELVKKGKLMSRPARSLLRAHSSPALGSLGEPGRSNVPSLIVPESVQGTSGHAYCEPQQEEECGPSPSQQHQLVTRRNLRIRATCHVSIRCRKQVGLPSPDHGRGRRGFHFGLFRCLGRLTQLVHSLDKVFLICTGLRVMLDVLPIF